MAAVTVAILVALVACIAGLVMRAMKDYRSGPSIPGPPALPILGHALSFINMDIDMLFQELLKLIDGRPLTKLSILNHSLIIVSDPTHIGELVRRKDLNDKAFLGYSFLHVAAKRGLIQLGGSEWKEHRSWLAPGFKKSVLDTFVSVFNDVSKDYLKTLPLHQDLQVRVLVARSMASAFIATALGEDGGVLDNADTVTDFIDMFFRGVMARSFNPLLWPDKIYRLTAEWRKIQKKMLDVDSFTTKFIILKREELKNKKQSEEPATTTKRRTLMDIMIETPENHEPMSEEAIQDEVKTSYAASVETTATAICWGLKIMTLMPEVQERLYAELDEVFGDSDRDVTLEDILKLKYMERFFKEVLRMYPPVPFIARQCYNKTELWGYPIPANSTIAMNLFSTHRDPRYWSEPDRFDPDRFLTEAAKDRHPYAYMPFSAGSRNCVGGTYAMQLMTIFMATTLRAVSPCRVDDGHKDVQSLTDHMTYTITAGLRGGIRVKFRPRGQPTTASG